MKITVKNLGVLKKAEFSLGDLTIICGENNTGKTYATYALYGFLMSWRDFITVDVKDEDIQRLLNDGSVKLNVKDYAANSKEILRIGCDLYTKSLPSVFASSIEHCKDAKFMLEVDVRETFIKKSFKRNLGSAKTPLFTISKEAESDLVNVSLIVEKEELNIENFIVKDIISMALKDVIFGHLFPSPFIASAERTGAAIFKNELDFARNRLLEEMSSKKKDFNPVELLFKVYSDYAWPVKSNVDFTRSLDGLRNKRSFIHDVHINILDKFTDIIGGEYQVDKSGEIHYMYKDGNKRIRLTMNESSSIVRSLLDVGFYLRHVANHGDLLMVDEPELNLHPVNQRRVARLFARLVNAGIKVFITTHSDYIIKELNTLILLNQKGKKYEKIAEREGYVKEELLDYNKVKVYIAKKTRVKAEETEKKISCHSLIPAPVQPESGIEVDSFDDTIHKMNQIQDEIIWGDDEE